MIVTKITKPTKVTLVFERTQLGWDAEHAKLRNITEGERRRDHYDVYLVIETGAGKQRFQLDYGIEYMQPGGRIQEIEKPIIDIKVRDIDCVDENAPLPASKSVETEPAQLRFSENGLQIVGREGKELATKEEELAALEKNLNGFSEQVDELKEWIATRPGKKHICLACDKESEQTKLCIPCVTEGWYLDDSERVCLESVEEAEAQAHEENLENVCIADNYAPEYE